MREALSVLAVATALLLQSYPAAAANGSPVVVELFTAQGCAACVKPDATLDGLADRRGVIALTFPVDYWDYLGWRDTFAQPAFTERQRAYATRLKVKEIYTPEVVVDGRREAPGVDDDRVDALIGHAAALPREAPPIRFERHGERVEVGIAPRRLTAHDGEVWLARYDPTAHVVHIKTGENKGKTVTVRNVVRELVRLGAWSGQARRYRLPEAKDKDLTSVVLVQNARGGRIIAAARD